MTTVAQPLAANATHFSNAPGDTSTRLQGRRLLLVRAVWLVFIGLDLLLFIIAVPATFNASVRQGLTTDQNALAQLGLSVGGYAAFRTGLPLAGTFISLAIALFLFWRRSDDWMVLLVSFVFITVAPGTAFALGVLAATQPAWLVPVLLQFDVGLIATTLLVFTFPTGRFVPAWTRLALILFAVLVFAHSGVNFVQHTLFDPTSELIVCYSLGVIAQIYRYRRATGAIQRQQFRWIVFGFFIYAPIFVLFSLLGAFVVPTLPEAQRLLFGLWGALFLFYVPALLLFMTAVFATLRYRLWDIDLLIRRTLIYGVLTVTLALVYFGSIVVLGQVVRAFTGRQQSDVVIVISTLAIAALFMPLRARIQQVIDRRFYRRKYDVQQVLAAFGATVRDEVDLAKLRDKLLEVVDETMQPEHVSLWLKTPR